MRDTRDQRTRRALRFKLPTSLPIVLVFAVIALVGRSGAFADEQRASISQGTTAQRRTITFGDCCREQDIFLGAGEPTQVIFPAKVQGSGRRGWIPITWERKDNFLVFFASDQLSKEGWPGTVYLQDKRRYPFRFLPAATAKQPRDEVVTIEDQVGCRGPVPIEKHNQ